MGDVDKLQIDFLLTADRAEALNGKLYVMGGAWDRRIVQSFDEPVTIGLAAALLVPWNLTDQNHDFNLAIEDAEGNVIGEALSGGFKVGRPADATQGQAFRTIIAAHMQTKLPGPGAYRIRLTIREDEKTTVFYAVSAKGATQGPG